MCIIVIITQTHLSILTAFYLCLLSISCWLQKVNIEITGVGFLQVGYTLSYQSNQNSSQYFWKALAVMVKR